MGAQITRYYVSPQLAEYLKSKRYVVQTDYQGKAYFCASKDTYDSILKYSLADYTGSDRPQGPSTSYSAGVAPTKGDVRVTDIPGGVVVSAPNQGRIVGLDSYVDAVNGSPDNNPTQQATTTINLSEFGGRDAYVYLQQLGLVTGANNDYTKCTIPADKLNDIKTKLTEYSALPKNLSQVQFSGDQTIQEKIKQQLLQANIIDQQGNIIDKVQFANLCENGIVVDEQTYAFTKSESDASSSVPVTTTTITVGGKKFRPMNPAIIEAIKRRSPDGWQAYLEQQESQGLVAIIDGKYYTSTPANQIPPDSTPVTPITGLVGNQANQDARESQLHQDFLDLYDSNPANAQDTLLHTKYYKAYKALEDALIQMNRVDMSDIKTKDYGNEVAYKRKSVLARSYFAEAVNMNGDKSFEYATEADIQELNNKIQRHLDDLRQKTIQEQIGLYKTHFGDVVDTNIDSLSEAQLQQLAEAMAYAEGLTDAQIKRMASIQFQNRFNTQMNEVLQEYNEKIEEAKRQGKNDKVTKLQRELNEKLQEIREEQMRVQNEDRSDYARMMARGQLNSEIGEEHYNNVSQSLTYEKIIAECPEAKDFIAKNKTLFYDGDTFSVQKWQNFWLRKSADREDNNTDEDNNPVNDYFMSLGEAQQILKGNAGGTKNEAYVGLEAIYRGKNEDDLINLALKMAETAGISTEANNTAGLRTAYVFKEIGKGMAATLAADVLSNFVMSKIHIPYAGQVTGVVTGNVSGTVNFARSGVIQDLDTFVSQSYENGRLIDEQVTNVAETHMWSVEGSENYSQDYSQEYSQNYSGSRKLRAFRVDPWAVGIGAIGGLIKGLINKGKIHDKEDGNSRIQMYARRDYNEKPSLTPTVETTSIDVPNFQYTAKVVQQTLPVDIKNNDYKITFSNLRTDNQNRQYRDFQDKKAIVAACYGIEQTHPQFDGIYKFVMETTNGLSANQYGTYQYVNGTTYHFPQTILTSQVEGLGSDLNYDSEANLANIPQTVRIYYTSGTNVAAINNQNNTTKRPGSNASTTIIAK